MGKFAFTIVIEDIKNPNLIVSGGLKNKHKGAYKEIFKIINEDYVFVEFESEYEELIGNDFYLYFNLVPSFEKLQRINDIPNVKTIIQTYGKAGLLAPNGKPSNLNATQYELVRTLAFKSWFGDWENDPANASKVVDDNGEPLVVYHNSDTEFNIFELKGLSNGFFFTKNIEDEEFSQRGWLKSIGLTYEQAIEKDYDLKYEKAKSYFLKIKQFFTKSNVKNSSWSTPYFENEVIEFAKRNKKNDGVEFLREIDNKQIIVAFEPNQIKLADGTNTTFDSGNDDIRFDNGGMTNADGFVIEELDDDLKEVYQNRAYKNVGEANFYFSRLNIYPELNVFTIELPNGMEVGRATLNEKGNYLTNIRLDYDYRRRGLASNLYNYIEYVTGKKLKPSPDKISKEAEKLWLKRNPDIQFKNGGRTISQTPSPKKDRIVGSDLNKKSSSKNLSSAKFIKFEDKTLNSIKSKVSEHNDKYPDKKINLASAKAVVRRGMGAYSGSHRPTISGGKPNSRVAWGLARLNAFTYKIVNGKSKSGKYTQDDDLIEELGFKVADYKNGGEMKKDIRCINCGWEWNKKDSEAFDMYVCHKCGFDNTSFYASDPVNRLLKGGKLNSVKGVSPDYLKMFLGK